MENNIHNDFFVNMMKDEKNASDFLWGVLPDDIKCHIDLTDINYDDTSHIQQRFKDLFSDIVIKTKIDSDDLDIYLLVEHKSVLPDEDALFLQILGYIYSMLEKDYTSKKSFRTVLPLVFYHGTGKWEIQQFFHDLYHINNSIKKYLLNFGYLLYNSSDFDENRKDQFHNNLLLISSLTALKTAFNKSDINSVFRVLSNLNDLGILKDFNKIEIFLIYILKTKNIEEKEIIEILSKYDNEGGKKMETLAEYFTEIGVRRGEELGIQKGKIEGKIETAIKMLQRSIDISIISDVTELSAEEIKKLKLN